MSKSSKDSSKDINVNSLYDEKELKYSCNIVTYLEAARPKIHAALKRFCALGKISKPPFGCNGLTFIIPNTEAIGKLIDFMRKQDFDKLNDYFGLFVIKGYFPEQSNWFRGKTPKTIITDTQEPKQVIISGIKGNNIVLGDGTELKKVDFVQIITNKKHTQNMCIYEIVGSKAPDVSKAYGPFERGSKHDGMMDSRVEGGNYLPSSQQMNNEKYNTIIKKICRIGKDLADNDNSGYAPINILYFMKQQMPEMFARIIAFDRMPLYSLLYYTSLSSSNLDEMYNFVVKSRISFSSVSTKDCVSSLLQHYTSIAGKGVNGGKWATSEELKQLEQEMGPSINNLEPNIADMNKYPVCYVNIHESMSMRKFHNSYNSKLFKELAKEIHDSVAAEADPNTYISFITQCANLVMDENNLNSKMPKVILGYCYDATAKSNLNTKSFAF